eukprot:5995835-Amphidinium_carterae.1
MSTDTKKRHTYAKQYQERHHLHASTKTKPSKKRKTFPGGSLGKDDAEQWVPEGWKVSYDDKNGRWLLYSVKKDKTVSRSWLYHGHDGALKLALQACWTHFLAKNGKAPSDCPHDGIFDACASSSGPSSSGA